MFSIFCVVSPTLPESGSGTLSKINNPIHKLYLLCHCVQGLIHSDHSPIVQLKDRHFRVQNWSCNVHRGRTVQQTIKSNPKKTCKLMTRKLPTNKKELERRHPNANVVSDKPDAFNDVVLSSTSVIKQNFLSTTKLILANTATIKVGSARDWKRAKIINLGQRIAWSTYQDKVEAGSSIGLSSSWIVPRTSSVTHWWLGRTWYNFVTDTPFTWENMVYEAMFDRLGVWKLAQPKI